MLKKIKILKIFYRFLWRYKKNFIFFGFILLIWSVAVSLNPYFYKLFIDAIFQKGFSDLIKILIIFVGFRILVNLLDVLVYYWGDKILIPASKDARIAIFRHIQDLDFAYHTEKSTGSLISIFKRGDGSFFDLFHALNINIVRILVGFLVMFFFFTDLGKWIALPMFFILIFNSFLVGKLVIINIRKRREFNKAEDGISAIIADNLINFDTVKYFAKEKWEQKRLIENFSDWAKKLWQFTNSFRFMDLSVGMVANLGVFFLLFYSLKKYSLGEITSGDLVLILGFVTEFFNRFFDLFFSLRTIVKCYVDISRYFNILDEKILVKDSKNPLKIDKISGEIKFCDVDFSYPQGREGALRDFNLEIKSGETVALVGSSGAGKTTVVKLLMRFYDVDKGRIIIDGGDIRRFNKSDLRSFIGIVPQETILFNETIAYNIGYGLPEIKIEAIKRAAKIANLSDFIESLPQKYETLVGERGIKLSGGQRQRLSIARVVLSKPEIIIFDEATSQLDSESENLVQEAFWKMKKNKTTIIIAHRLSTIKKADRIVVIDNGKIVEKGTHKQLLSKKDSLYHHFWKLQTELV